MLAATWDIENQPFDEGCKVAHLSGPAHDEVLLYDGRQICLGKKKEVAVEVGVMWGKVRDI